NSNAEAIFSGASATASAGNISLVTLNNMNSGATGKGESATAAGGTSVGVGVAINVAKMTNTALIAGGAVVTADRLGNSGKMRNVGANTEHNHFAKASSSAAGGDTGVAGSCAINYVESNTKALGGGVGSVLTLNGGAIDIDAESKSRHYVLASSKGLSKGSGS